MHKFTQSVNNISMPNDDREDLVPRKRPIMTPQELAFIDEMVRAPDEPSACAMRAGYDEIQARYVAPALLKRQDVVQAINEGRAQVRQVIAQTTGIELARVVQLLAELASFDPADCYDPDGRLLPLHEMPRAARMAIEGIDTEEMFESGGRGNPRVHVGDVRKIKWGKRTTSLDMLMRHLGGYELDNRQKTDPVTDLLRELAGGRSNTIRISDD